MRARISLRDGFVLKVRSISEEWQPEDWNT
jgi:hypothetical protein